ncbi:hypothetical protein GCM10011348_20700 [Marinobacterium nitratireducens]|uniref:RND family efflux transporter, MFP subunit n=1 Tax=Marinobacterium nitratireducens TaxID=518897 RepID=A0A917ZEG2_9GAMM|nr:efflux RND transporter periplasmic adaptor subunit [Marinobacterium nitratireducens]GGO81505.1 hypothetical protein GCM10011348_20700 [Marinobacterium nitratireducens]
MGRTSGLILAAWCIASVVAVPVQAADDRLATTPSRSSDAVTAHQARGVLRARDKAVLSSEQAGRILAMPFGDGQPFDEGQVLVSFDCSAYRARLKAAQASVRVAQEELGHARQLASLNSVGRFEVTLAEARQAQARAEAEIYAVQVERCEIKAPFKGRVVERLVQPHESVAAGAPLLEIVDNTSLEVQLLVPSGWLGWLRPGQSFRFVPDETRRPLQARVERLGAAIDEGSQTLLLIGTLPADASGLLAGMSGNAEFGDTP